MIFAIMVFITNDNDIYDDIEKQYWLHDILMIAVCNTEICISVNKTKDIFHWWKTA